MSKTERERERERERDEEMDVVVTRDQVVNWAFDKISELYRGVSLPLICLKSCRRGEALIQDPI